MKRTLILHGRISQEEMTLLKEMQSRRQAKAKKYVSLIDVVVESLKFADGQITK